MIKHVALFQLKEFNSELEKEEKLNEIKLALESLPSTIKEIISLEVGININASEDYDVLLNASFKSLEELDVYSKHPDHVAVGGIIRPVLEKRACVDFEF